MGYLSALIASKGGSAIKSWGGYSLAVAVTREATVVLG
jgi:hypothetical protein